MNPESSDQDINNTAVEGSILPTFLKYLIPSLIGILAMSTAAIIDAIFIGKYVGDSALAAVNLIMPFMALLFGVGLTLSVGGSVRAGKYIGENNYKAASAIFSKTLVVMTLVSIVICGLGYLLHELLFKGFGANDEVAPLMAQYLLPLLPFLVAQMITIVLYFFIRVDGRPNLAAIALALGSVINIVLDYVFIVQFQWGLKGAALATGLAQLIPMLILLSYFFDKNRQLVFSFKQDHWFEVFNALYNGLSEFVSEISAGVIAFILNWLLITSVGVHGVAAIAVINYILMIGFMMFFSLGDACQVIISQNFGAKKPKRIGQFLKLAFVFSIVVSVLCILPMLLIPKTLISMFLQDQAHTTIDLAMGYIQIIWAVFVFAGLNMIISAYLTAVHLPAQSALVAVFRTLIMPSMLLLIFYFWIPSIHFLWALPLAELVTFIVAMIIFIKFKPSSVVVALV